MKIIGKDELYFNSNFAALTQLIFLYNAERHPDGQGNVVVEIDPSHPSVVIQLVLGWVGAGGEIENFPAYLKISETAYAKEVPEGFPERSYFNTDEVEVVRKWSEWKDANHEHRKIGDYYYVPSNAFGFDIKGSELAQAHNLAGINVITVADYQKIVPVSQEG